MELPAPSIIAMSFELIVFSFRKKQLKYVSSWQPLSFKLARHKTWVPNKSSTKALEVWKDSLENVHAMADIFPNPFWTHDLRDANKDIIKTCFNIFQAICSVLWKFNLTLVCLFFVFSDFWRWSSSWMPKTQSAPFSSWIRISVKRNITV